MVRPALRPSVLYPAPPRAAQWDVEHVEDNDHLEQQQDPPGCCGVLQHLMDLPKQVQGARQRTSRPRHAHIVILIPLQPFPRLPGKPFSLPGLLL